jgi:hypothetical protein
MRLLPILLLASPFCALLLPAQTPILVTQVSLRALYVEDQRDRGVPLADDGKSILSKAEADKLPSYDWQQMSKRDEERRKLTHSLMEQGKLQTGEDFYDAAFIFQHGQSPDDYLLAHVLAVEAIAHGEHSAIWISAATLDRYLQSLGQKQIFGTQYSDGKYAFYLQHRNDKNLDAEMQAFDASKWTLEPYDETLLPNTIRQDFCVPNRDLQHAYVDAVNAGKNATPPRLSDCRKE